VRATALLLLLAMLVLASAAAAASRPSYTISFTGNGTERQNDTRKNIQDSGVCDSAEHVDVTASLAWSASWNRFQPGKGAAAGPVRIEGSAIQGTDVKDACGLDLSQAPPGWVGQTSCAQTLAMSAAPSVAVERKTAKALVLALTAPSLAVPVGAGCALNVRNDQLVTHVSVPLKKLNALRRGQSLVFATGTLRPGPGDLYAPTLDCSQPTKPYEGYRTADECNDALSWSGTVKITRAS
jgi:type 1 fimbria pilin